MKFIEEFERIVYSVLKLNFDCKKIEDVFDKYIDDKNLKKYYNSFISIEISKKISNIYFL